VTRPARATAEVPGTELTRLRARLAEADETLRAIRNGEVDAVLSSGRQGSRVFSLQGAQVGAMWRMLCARGTDLRIEFANVSAGESVGGADWQAWYAFSATGRQVHNVIHAAFRFADGLIVEHIDTFDFWRWSRQALGMAGVLLGWTPWLHGKVRRDAARALERFMASSR